MRGQGILRVLGVNYRKRLWINTAAFMSKVKQSFNSTILAGKPRFSKTGWGFIFLERVVVNVDLRAATPFKRFF